MEIKPTGIKGFSEVYDDEGNVKMTLAYVETKEKEKSAKEMFEELGYELQIEDKDIIAFKYKYALGGYKEIIFSKKSDGLYIDYSFDGKQLTFVSYKEVKAINKQVEELGWNNETYD